MDIWANSLGIHHACLRSYAGLSRGGEISGRSSCPCVPQVDADAMVWLRSLHGPMQTGYISVRIRVPPTYVSGAIISIPLVLAVEAKAIFQLLGAG